MHGCDGANLTRGARDRRTAAGIELWRLGGLQSVYVSLGGCEGKGGGWGIGGFGFQSPEINPPSNKMFNFIGLSSFRGIGGLFYIQNYLRKCKRPNGQ